MTIVKQISPLDNQELLNSESIRRFDTIFSHLHIAVKRPVVRYIEPFNTDN